MIYALLSWLTTRSPARGLLAEHGLSYWIEADRHRLMFDVGQGVVLGHNLETLEIDVRHGREFGAQPRSLRPYGQSRQRLGGHARCVLVSASRCGEEKVCEVRVAAAPRYRNAGAGSRCRTRLGPRSGLDSQHHRAFARRPRHRPDSPSQRLPRHGRAVLPGSPPAGSRTRSWMTRLCFLKPKRAWLWCWAARMPEWPIRSIMYSS